MDGFRLACSVWECEDSGELPGLSGGTEPQFSLGRHCGNLALGRSSLTISSSTFLRASRKSVRCASSSQQLAQHTCLQSSRKSVSQARSSQSCGAEAQHTRLHSSPMSVPCSCSSQYCGVGAQHTRLQSSPKSLPRSRSSQHCGVETQHTRLQSSPKSVPKSRSSLHGGVEAQLTCLLSSPKSVPSSRSQYCGVDAQHTRLQSSPMSVPKSRSSQHWGVEAPLSCLQPSPLSVPSSCSSQSCGVGAQHTSLQSSRTSVLSSRSSHRYGVELLGMAAATTTTTPSPLPSSLPPPCDEVTASRSCVREVLAAPKMPSCWMWNADGLYCHQPWHARPKIQLVKKALVHDVVGIVETHAQSDAADILHPRHHCVYTSRVHDAVKCKSTGGVLCVLRKDWLQERMCTYQEIVPGRALAVRVSGGDCVDITITVAHVYGRDEEEWFGVMKEIADFQCSLPDDVHIYMCDSNAILEKCDRQARADGMYSGKPGLRAK
eukprot:5738838-Amphidinium_carterae.1